MKLLNIYSSDYSKQYNIDKHSLKKTMNVVKGHKDRNRDFIFGNQTPYLSSYFNWIVLDNLTLSDSKINQIEKIFFDTSSFQLETTDFIRNENVKITNITSKSTFDTAQQAWVQGRWVTQILHPEISDKEWLRSVRYSFISKVMTPVTSYLVVENDAQKAILKKKQEQVLSGNKSLDLDDDTQRMSEPGFWIMAFFLLIILGCKEIIRKQKQHS